MQHCSSVYIQVALKSTEDCVSKHGGSLSTLSCGALCECLLHCIIAQYFILHHLSPPLCRGSHRYCGGSTPRGCSPDGHTLPPSPASKATAGLSEASRTPGRRLHNSAHSFYWMPSPSQGHSGTVISKGIMASEK